MAPKKPTPFEQQPRADSSSDDEEEVSSEEEVSEESEEGEPKKIDPKPHSSSEEDGSDSGSDEEVTPVAPVKPVVVQSPKVGAKSKQKQPAPATAPASAVTVAAKLGKKRLGESKADGKDSKKSKVVDMEDKRVAEEEVKKVGEDPKKQLFQRLFSEEDEIVMLKALLHYSAKKCIDPIEDFKDFHDFVKKAIHVDVTTAQLADKIRRLKKKYKKNASKTKEGVHKTFGKPHEQLCYDLSKKIWEKSASANGGSELKATGKGKRTPKPNMTPDQKEKHASGLQIPVKEEPVRENSSTLFCLSELAKTKNVVGMMGLSDDIFKKGFELLSDEARAALEDKCKNMATAEAELYYKRLELSREQVKLTLDALKSSGHH